MSISPLQEARFYLGLSTQNVAAVLTCSEQDIVAMEDGKILPTARQLEKLAHLYHCSPAFLRGEEDIQVSEAIAKAPGWDSLNDLDRDALARFAYFLQQDKRDRRDNANK